MLNDFVFKPVIRKKIWSIWLFKQSSNHKTKPPQAFVLTSHSKTQDDDDMDLVGVKFALPFKSKCASNDPRY